MRHALIIACTLALAAPAVAQDFSEGSEAQSWNLVGEQKARFAARVVDPLCELGGDCEAQCAQGRQLALLRAADDVMVLPLKNGQPAFSGAAADLAPFCGAEVEVDGLLIDNPDLGVSNIYQLQRIRGADDEEWTTANRFTEAWAEAHPEAAGDGPWFRRDPRIRAEIEEEGWLGLGPEAEQAFLRDWLGVE